MGTKPTSRPSLKALSLHKRIFSNVSSISTLVSGRLVPVFSGEREPDAGAIEDMALGLRIQLAMINFGIGEFVYSAALRMKWSG